MAPGQRSSLRVVVNSERRMFRDALAGCLLARPEYVVVGHVGHLGDLTALCRLSRPDVALVDVGSGCADIAGLRACVALTTVVVVYERLSVADLGALCRAGVDTVLPSAHGLDALMTVLGRYLAGDPAGAADARDGFTELERQLITLVGAGHTVHEIAQLLEVSTSAVAHTKRRIYRKLEVGCQGQAIARAAALGIVARQPERRPAPGCPAAPGPVVLRGTAGPTWEVVTAALLAGGVPVGRTPAGGSLLVLVDPVAADWPALDGAAPPVVLVCGTPPPRAEVLTALLRGARAVLSAERVPTDLVPACTLAVRGHVTVDPDAARAVLDAVHAPFTAPGLPDLTARELDILGLIAAGHTVRQTARALGIAEKTVENTQSRLYRKLGARNRSGALVTAHALGLLEHPEPETAR